MTEAMLERELVDAEQYLVEVAIECGHAVPRERGGRRDRLGWPIALSRAVDRVVRLQRAMLKAHRQATKKE